MKPFLSFDGIAVDSKTRLAEVECETAFYSHGSATQMITVLYRNSSITCVTRS